MTQDHVPPTEAVGPVLAGAVPTIAADAAVPTTTVQPDPAVVTRTPAERRRLYVSLLVGYLALFATYAGVIVILLPQQVALIDPANKVADLAAVTATAAGVCLFVQPIIGAVSDRTRSRLGRRAPWLVIGGVGGGVATIVLQFSQTLFWIALVWVLADVLLNTFQGPLSAVIADRVEQSQRGFASAFTGVGTAVGGTLGVVVAGQLLAHIGIAYWIFGGAMIVVSVAFVLANRDRSSRDDVHGAWSWSEFARSFWISPRKSPDYAWAFGGRFFMVLGYQAISAYQLYILTDYIGLTDARAGTVIGLLSICSMIALVVGTLVAGKLSDRLNSRKLFVFIASIMIAIGAVVPLVWPSVPAMVVYSFIVGLGYGAYTAVDLALMIDVLPSQGSPAKDLGVLNVASNVPQAITPVVAAVLLSLFGGHYAAIFVYAIVSVVVSSVLVFPIKSVR